ncbi:MAG: hypothetical protein AB1671_07900, partial [Thermodesulfobacteriota bacterium]
MLVIFGGGGDLAWRKLIPAMFNLYRQKSLPDRFALIGVDRVEFADDAACRQVKHHPCPQHLNCKKGAHFHATGPCRSGLRADDGLTHAALYWTHPPRDSRPRGPLSPRPPGRRVCPGVC